MKPSHSVTTKMYRSFVLLLLVTCPALGQYREISKILRQCRRSDPKFDECLMGALNYVRPYFKTGIPELGVAPFDPHFAPVVNQLRRLGNLKYHLQLTNVSEFGWSQSVITKFMTDFANDRIIYTQYFPDKSLIGRYILMITGLGHNITRMGDWNLRLQKYSQTTTITRTPAYGMGYKNYDGQPLDVKVQVDEIGDMELHATNIFNGANLFEVLIDLVVNRLWRIGLPVVRPLINDLVSTAFTEILTNSFRNFPFSEVFP